MPIKQCIVTGSKEMNAITTWSGFFDWAIKQFHTLSLIISTIVNELKIK